MRRISVKFHNSFTAELIAMLEAVKVVRKKKLKNVNIWADSKALVEVLRNYRVNSDKRLKEIRKVD